MKLKKLLESKGISQTELARMLARDKSAITNLFQGKRQLKADEAMVIAQALGVNVAEVLGVDEPQGVSESVLIPFHHAPKSKRNARQVVEKKGKFYLEESGKFSAKTYALEVKDDSLNLSGILAGDIVLAELDASCKAGQIVVVQHYSGAGAETILRQYEPPLLMAHSTNAAHKPLHLERDDVRVVSPVIKLVRLL